jgi:hypothetical protein
MENFHNQPNEQNPHNIIDHETQGDDAWRLAKWKELQEKGYFSGLFSLTQDGQLKPYPSGLFVPPPLDEAYPYPYTPPTVTEGE